MSDTHGQVTDPIAAFSIDARRMLVLRPERVLELADLDDRTLAALIRRRLALARQQGRAVMGTFGATFAAILCTGSMVRSDLLMGISAAVIASVAASTAFVLERGAFQLFRRESASVGLSQQASQVIYQRAGDAEAWIAVLEACGQVPDDRDLAGFVVPERRRK